MAEQVQASERLEADISRTLGELHSTFNPFRSGFMLDYQVTAARDGYVMLSFALPASMVRVFVGLLDSLAGMFRVLDHRGKIAVRESRPVDLSEEQRLEDQRREFTDKVCALFDRFTADGLPRNEAVKRTNRALKDENEPWANHVIVTDTLRGAGRFRKGVQPRTG